MQINNIAQLLQNTLNPQYLNQAEAIILSERNKQGFLTNLLIISADNNYNILIRQSALINIKNTLFDDYKQETTKIPDNDFQTVKSSIFPALIRNCQQKLLTPTLRQIIYVLAKYQFPHNWNDIIPQIAHNIQKSEDFNQIYGSIETLKAIVSAFSQKNQEKITLQNLCNKVMLPLLSLASKLFQNYNQTTSIILISIFKIFNTVIIQRIPDMILLNIHSWMIFIKKLLDLNIESGNIDENMYILKKICLRILFRFYQRHLSPKYSILKNSNFIQQFHQKFTKGIVQSLLLQIINQAHLSNTENNRNYIELTKLSLTCLSCIYQENRSAAMLIDNYKGKIIYLCLERYKIKLNKKFQSYNEFTSKLTSQRVHLSQFIRALIQNKTKVAQQKSKGNYNYSNSYEISDILGNLYGHIQKGEMDIKQICLYLYSDIAQILVSFEAEIQSKMLAFILTVVKPLLNNQDSPTIVRLRCCQVLSKYSFIQIPQSELTDIAGGVYSCLISNKSQPDSGSMETFLQIHAVHAFNSLLRYDFIINFTSPFLNNILQVYTSLLEIQISVIKCFEDMLQRFQSCLEPYANGLVQMLINMYFKYSELVANFKNKQLSQNELLKIKSKQDDEEQEEVQSVDNNFLNASKACLGAIRQIIQVSNISLAKEELMHNLLISIFSDKDQLHIEEGFNILNQVIFKQKGIKNEYNIYFSLIIFGILPITSNYVDRLKSQNSSYSDTLLRMMEALCLNPDRDFLENTIGCLRNFIAKYQNNLRVQCDKSGLSYLQLVLNVVSYVHQNQSTKATQTDRSIVLTVYSSLIEWKAINENQLKQILKNISNWLSMQKQACFKSQANNSAQNNYLKNGNQQPKKTVYCPIYVQIVLLAAHFYPETTLNIMNGNWIGRQLLENWDRFHCDYELSRLLIGIGDLLQHQAITDELVSRQIMNRITQIIQKQCKIRVGEDDNDINSEDDQAYQDKFFGMDENTHIMGWKNNLSKKQNQQSDMEDQDQSQEEEDEDLQFNKYYESPLDSIDQINYIANVLRSNNCSAYMCLMRTQLQQKLSFLITNVPNKFSMNQN